MEKELAVEVNRLEPLFENEQSYEAFQKKDTMKKE